MSAPVNQEKLLSIILAVITYYYSLTRLIIAAIILPSVRSLCVTGFSRWRKKIQLGVRLFAYWNLTMSCWCFHPEEKKGKKTTTKGERIVKEEHPPNKEARGEWKRWRWRGKSCDGIAHGINHPQRVRKVIRIENHLTLVASFSLSLFSSRSSR